MTLALQVLLIVIVVGMLTIGILFHRFSRAPPTDVVPETPTAPSKLMLPAIQGDPALPWHEIVFISVLCPGNRHLPAFTTEALTSPLGLPQSNRVGRNRR